jgi:uncharacterized membrane protein YhhN
LTIGSLIGIYIIIAGLAIWTKYSSPKLFQIFKPAPLFLLILFSLVTSQHYLLIFALVFSFSGDIFLLNKEKYFVQGLISFLIAHLFYLSLFIESKSNPNAVVSVMVLIIAAFYFGYLKIYLGKYLYPVLIYLSAISLMVVFATGANGGNSIMIGVGAILFFISDGVLAFNKFVKKFKLADVAVLSTYYLAQLLLVWGLG